MKQISTFIKTAFIIVFVIITNLFFYYTISFVSPEPKFDAFCPVRNEQYTTPEQCVAVGGQWTNYQMAPKEITEAVKNGQQLGYCDPNATCQKDYDSAQSVYNKNVFIAMIIIAVVMVVAGVIVPVQVLSAGMVWSGVLALVIATLRFWSDANNIMKVLILGIGIAILTWLAVKKMNYKE